jgi:hypothetical protein
MKIEQGKGVSAYGPGVDIHLSADEVATAIDAYIVAHGAHVVGPRTVLIDGWGVNAGVVHVDPSGKVFHDGRVTEGGPQVFEGQRYVSLWGHVRMCTVTLTETAMIKPNDYMFIGDELYFIETPTDDYDWGNYRNKVAVKVTRKQWMAGELK